MNRKFQYLVVLLLLAFLAGCYPGGAEYVDELDTAISQYNDSYDFDGPKTYMMPDSVVHYRDGEENEGPSREWDEKILNQIENQFESLGYTRKYPPAEGEPDISVDYQVYVGALVKENSGYYWWDYWYDYWGWYYPGYPGWGYPGYPGWGYPGWGYPVYYSYTTGSLVITMTDPNTIKPIEGTNKEVTPVIYVGGVNGLLQGSDSYIDSRVETGINDLFNQAPFN